MQKWALVNSTTDTLKNPRLRDRTDKAWFCHLLQHVARKQSGSILSTPEPARDYNPVEHRWNDLGDGREPVCGDAIIVYDTQPA